MIIGVCLNNYRSPTWKNTLLIAALGTDLYVTGFETHTEMFDTNFFHNPVSHLGHIFLYSH